MSAMRAERRRTLLAGVSLACMGSAPALGQVAASIRDKGLRPGYDGTVKARGDALVNGAGAGMQLRGMNIQAHALAMIKGNADAGGGPGNDGGPNEQAGGPNLSVLRKWKCNAIRIGINEACWLGYDCYSTAVNGDGVTGHVSLRKFSGASSYQQQITRQIAALNSIGCYVVLTLAATNPGRSAPGGQDWMANQDNSIECWRSIAQAYGYPHGKALRRNGGSVDDRSVVFELFNEPEMYGNTRASWIELMEGGFRNQAYTTNGYGAFGDIPSRPVFPFPCTTPAGSFIPGEIALIGGTPVGRVLCHFRNTTTGLPSSGTDALHLFTEAGYGGDPPQVPVGSRITGSASRATVQVTGHYGWYVAGHKQMLAAIRGTGAGNLCLLSGVQYDQDMSGWAEHAPADASPPSGFTEQEWTPQVAACWHPYPGTSWIKNATVASGGSGYAIGDTILLPMPQSGPAANSVYWQAQLRVTGVSGGAVTAVQLEPYTGGTPGRAGGNAGQYNSHQSGGALLGGAYCNLFLPANPVAQESSSRGGRGATFNLSFTDSRGDGWPNRAFWPQVVALKNARGVPVVVTETGEHYGKGVSGSPWMAALTAWCDANDISLIAYAYTPSFGWTDLDGGDFGVIDGNDVPTPGYGDFMHSWLVNHSP